MLACDPEWDFDKGAMAILRRIWLQDAHIARCQRVQVTRTDLCFMHMQKGRCLEEFGYLAYHVWWPQIRYITSSDHVARGRGALDRDAVQVGVFVGS